MIADILNQIDELWPFRRVVAPDHLVQRWNEQFSDEKGQILKEVAFTVDKGAVVTDDMLWEMMTTEFKVTKMIAVSKSS
jgi:hypothetical protein